uniref:Endophilin-B1 n=1 Tax=Cacopsylla melanoneura TaxID=428564 RepID=A0A8D8VMM2_9HEMI
MDFNSLNMKQFVKDAGSALSRVVQLTEEKLGTSEKTELDAHFESLAGRADVTKLWTEKMVSDCGAVLIPNPGNRVEDFLFEKIEKKKPSRLSNMEYLGIDMTEAGNAFGPGTTYGTALIKVGQYEQKLGTAEREFVNNAHVAFVQPLQKFLDGEMKTIVKERSLLESKRLDLDSCKNRVRKARGLLGTQANIEAQVKHDEAERDLRIAQSEFDRQAEITKLLLEGVQTSHSSHLRCLHEFVESQVDYYANCHKIMQELKNELSNTSSTGSSSFQNQSLNATNASPEFSPSFT